MNYFSTPQKDARPFELPGQRRLPYLRQKRLGTYTSLPLSYRRSRFSSQTYIFMLARRSRIRRGGTDIRIPNKGLGEIR